LCGKQGIALRGHRDDGRLIKQSETSQKDPISNEGNFRAILRYRAEVDDELRQHLTFSAQNAIYTSKTFQNEIIDIYHNLTIKYIVKNINESQGFSILADGTTDIAGIDQFTICVRYFDQSLNLREDFLAFVPITKATGEELAKTIINYLLKIGKDCSFWYGQGYDGAPAMSGEFHGAQAYVQSSFQLVIYVHCAAHSLNLAINSACEVVGIRML
jgi:hypothetical protein